MNTYIEAILTKICQKLQLSPYLYQLADERYHTIADEIQGDEEFENLELDMYPQGSFRLKTTVKPIGENEYDLDFVVQLPKNSTMSPQQLYRHILRILSSDGKHKDMLESKARCIRVNYANDFHLDIMPGKLLDEQTNEIIVPDKELKGWYHHSNPKGYAQWFENKARNIIKLQILNERDSWVKCSTEDVDDQEIAARLEPLRRAVQLVKRYRDIYCERVSAEPVRSIVICTLMGQISSHYSSTLEIIRDFGKYVEELIRASGDRPFTVHNPVVDEVLTEKWETDEQIYKDFVGMIEALVEDISKLNALKVNSEIVKLMCEMFGETVTTEAVKEYANSISRARTAGTLAVGNDGKLNITGEGILVKPNTFYGQ